MKIATIEKAAKERCTTDTMQEWKKDFGVGCFMDGAYWRISSVWHDGKEMPGYNRDFIYQAIRKSGEIYYGMKRLFGDDEWDFMKEYCVLERWAYVDDLLPDRKED